MPSLGVPILGIGQVSLRVRDLSQSLAFYRGLLGLRDESNGSLENRVCICGAAGANDNTIRIVLVEGHTHADDLVRQHFVLEVPTEDDVRKVCAAAKARGYSATEPKVHLGRYQTYLFDPDGYKVGIMASQSSESDAGEDVL